MRAMTRLRAALIFLAVWACVYLPGLGSTELKGEEGRRILPAVTMLDTGNWLVPYVGGKPFLRKPPLVNWAIAGSFAVTGVRNEWTARLPSALCVLALGLTLIALGSGRGWMNAGTALVAAIMAATSFGLLAKARFAGAEIEGIYVPLAGIALATWMAWWTQRRSPWLTWTVPWIFLGLAALAKGPVHLVFFYAVVIAVLWKANPRALRELWHPAHFVGLALMAGIFAAWAVPYFQTETAHAAAKVWRDQMANRVTENVFDWKSYLLNIPRGLGDQLPWLLFAPLVLTARATDVRRLALVQGARLATGVCFVALLLIPGVLPRYVLPLTLPWAVLVAFALEGHSARRWVFIGAAAFSAASLIYGSVVVRFISRRESIRPVASQIDSAIPPGKALIIYDPDYRPEIFYLRARYEYAPDAEDIPKDAEFVLARGESRRRLARKRPDLVVTHTFTVKHDEELLLLQPRTAVREDARSVAPKTGAPQ
jgi:4-amino-4-deoxy-L-arabinose transferase-like glycosyltransferase